jgi:alpha-beta hydrolase superfamily lysophospholipase
VDSVVKDLAQLTGIIKKENPGVPVFIVGASWGSALVHLYIMQQAREVQGAVLGGSSDLPAFLIPLAIWIVKGRIKKYGPDAPNTLAPLGKNMNKDFLPSPTGTDWDWLSRDPEAVKGYASDPWCGWATPNQMFLDQLIGFAANMKPANERNIPVDLPLLFISGTRDPINAYLKNLRPLVNRYKNKYHFKDVSTKYYPDARHDLMHELNTDEVVADLLAWMEDRS